jgi:ABC-type polysaccharide/polyol phosphate export permease
MNDSPLGASFARSLQIQRKVIWALVMREVITRYGRNNIGFLWLFVEPMMFTLGITALWTYTGLHRSSDLPITTFALTGYSTVLLWRNMPSRCVGCIHPNASLMYHRNVRVLDIFFARIFLEAVGATISFVSLATMFIWVGWMAPPENLLLLAAAWLMTAWFGGALALVLGTWSEKSEIVEKLWHPAAYLIFPISGAGFLVEALPRGFQNVVLMLPMTHGTEMMRDGYFGSHFNAMYDFYFFFMCNMCLTLVGLSLERQVSKELTFE